MALNSRTSMQSPAAVSRSLMFFSALARRLFICPVVGIAIVLAAVVSMAAFPSTAAADLSQGGDTVISAVHVVVKIDKRMPASISDRISNTVEQVGDKALKGKTLDEAKDLEDSLLLVMKKIFSEVLTGFTVENLSFELAPDTTIVLTLVANEPFVRSVKIDVIPPQGISPFWNDTLSKGMNETADLIAGDIAGLPVDTESWSESLVKDIIYSRIDVEKRFPGFQVDTFLEMGEVVTVKLMLKPKDKIIRHVSVKMRSTTVPSVAIEGLKFDLARRVDLLLGLPVVFATDNQAFIAKELQSYLDDMVYSNKLRLDFDIRFLLDSNSVVTVVAESRSYSAYARLKVSLGQQVRNPDLEGHVGVFPIKDTELFTEFNFFPGPVDFQFNVGAGRRIGAIDIAAGRNIVDHLNRAWFTWNVNEDIIASLKKNVVEDKKKDLEASLMFRAHDFFSVELVSDLTSKVWVRFNANL